MSEPKETTNDTKIAQILLNQQSLILQLRTELDILKTEVRLIKDILDPRHHER